MKQELSRIWAREGVEIVWRQRETDVPAGSPFLSLTLIDDEERPHRRQEKYVLGDFLQDEGRIRISLFAATQTALKSASPSRRFRDSFERPLALGYVLGRAIAHEIGHALLGKSHTERGLMMATFDPAAMADAMSDHFRLSDLESVRLSLSRVSVRASARESAAADRVELQSDDAEALTR